MRMRSYRGGWHKFGYNHENEEEMSGRIPSADNSDNVEEVHYGFGRGGFGPGEGRGGSGFRRGGGWGGFGPGMGFWGMRRGWGGFGPGEGRGGFGPGEGRGDFGPGARRGHEHGHAHGHGEGHGRPGYGEGRGRRGWGWQPEASLDYMIAGVEQLEQRLQNRLERVKKYKEELKAEQARRKESNPGSPRQQESTPPQEVQDVNWKSSSETDITML